MLAQLSEPNKRRKRAMVILEVLQKAKGLLSIAIMLLLLNLCLFLLTGLNGSVAWDIAKYFALTLVGFFLIIIVWKPKGREKKTKFWAIYRILSFMTLMQDLAIAQGFLVASAFWVMAAAQVVIPLVYIRILQVYDRMLDQGDDLLLTEDIREWIGRFQQKSSLTKLISTPVTWLLCTFWYGSDILTLLFRKGAKTTAKDTWTILVPSSIIGTAGITSAIGLIVELAKKLF